MNLAPDPIGTAEERAMLDRIPELCFAVLKNTHVERSNMSEVCCSFELPVLGKRTKTAPTIREAIREVLLELAHVLTELPANEWPESWRNLALTVPAGRVVDSPEFAQAKRFQGKSRQFTIGVTMPVSLKLSLQSVAERQETTFSEAARRFVGAGFEDFDERSFSEGSEALLSLLSSEISKWQPSDREQVMVRLDQHVAVRLRSAAKEYSRSASEFGAMCLAHGLALQAHFVDIEQRVAAYRGPAARKLAPKVGLGSHAALLSGILSGSIVAPTRVLAFLSAELEAPAAALASFFKRSFESRAVPSFKAENGKPQISREPTPWKEAVESLSLPADEVKRLLNLNE